MGEEANAVLQHAQHLGPLDHSMQREALVCKEGYCYWYVSGVSVVCWWYVSVTGAPERVIQPTCHGVARLAIVCLGRGM
jgi:hypothetical protein